MTDQTTPSIVEFLAARLQEDEDAAKAVQTPYRLYVYDDGQVREPEIEDRPDSDDYGTYRRDIDGDDILPNRHTGYALLYDPARVLREVAAKRAIVDLHGGSHECSTYNHNGEVDNCTWCLGPEDCSTMLSLAAVYSYHPEFREEWKP